MPTCPIIAGPVTYTNTTASQLPHSFAHLMFVGRVKSALRLLNDTTTTVKSISLDNIQPSGKSVREIL